MQLITKKNYIPAVCIVYTCLVLYKIFTEGISHLPDSYYISNLIQMFVMSALAVALLWVSGLLSEWPLWLVILMQYGILLAVVMGWTWIAGRFNELASSAYRDEFRSLTIPFIVIAAVYYGKCYHELKKSNEILDELNGKTDGEE